jgi:chemotaxis regulatin CheY-phosphate phosphatase CheZ
VQNEHHKQQTSQQATRTLRYCYDAPPVHTALEYHNALCIQERLMNQQLRHCDRKELVRKTGSHIEKQVLISA